ncbi:MAG: hypothetical protein UDG86_02345 [Lachnospiraceae bacterium]|jgi:hypothetical protein|nr:hypothetical protein [Lachnospiraceae bacterium]
MVKKNRRRFSMGMAAVFLMALVMGMTADAAGKNIGEYFRVQIATDIIVTPTGDSISTFGFGGTITDWAQSVSADTSVSANLSRREGVGNTVPYPSVKWSWTLKKGTAVRKGYTTSVNIPSQFAGGTLTFAAEAVADSDWQVSTVEAVAEIR